MTYDELAVERRRPGLQCDMEQQRLAERERAEARALHGRHAAAWRRDRGHAAHPRLPAFRQWEGGARRVMRSVGEGTGELLRTSATGGNSPPQHALQATAKQRETRYCVRPPLRSPDPTALLTPATPIAELGRRREPSVRGMFVTGEACTDTSVRVKNPK